ncbi:MAG: hypothetical protein WEB06_04045 [Actinomycetota bacterium]
MHARSARASVWGVVLSASVLVGFAIAPVNAAPPPQANPSWGDISSVVAGPGLTGGATEGDAALAVLFGGNGSANSVARSDHDHDARYDARYAPLSHSHEFPAHNHDGLYAVLGHDHDASYLGLGGGTLNGFLTLAVGDLTLLGSGARLVAPQLVSTAPNGTAPLEVGSDTLVANLNADKLDGHDASEFALAGSVGPDLSGYAQLAGNNAFSGSNTFNGAATFGSTLNQVTGGANFTWQPFYSSATNYSLRLTDSGKSATRLIVNQDGRVGIGTTSPAFPLHVIGDIRATNLNLGTGILSPFAYDMSSTSDRTFSFTNSNGGVANLAVEGDVSAAGYHVATGGSAARAGSDAIESGASSRTVATSAVGGSSLVFVTPDATGSGCVPVPGPIYVSARNAGTSFTVAVVGAAPGAGESYCFSWWVVN